MGEIEIHQHSGYKIVLNSSSWVFSILGDYYNKNNIERVLRVIDRIVQKLRNNDRLHSIYRKIIGFDNLNQIFHVKGGGASGLIFEIYNSLEIPLVDDKHYWLQRAKSILYQHEKNIEKLLCGVNYALKARFDSNNKKLITSAKLT